MKPYRYLLFDLDGTLTDPKTGITNSVAYALRHFGITVDDPETLTRFIGPPLKDSFMDYYGFDESRANQAVSKYREYFGAAGLYENAVFAGVETLLDRLKKARKTLIVATSKPTVYAVKILAHFRLLRYFDFVSGSELDGSRVKKAEVIAYALERNGVADRSFAVMIGDRKHDVIGAKKNGIDSVGVLYGYGSRAELEQAGVDYIVEQPADLRAFFSR